MIGHIEMFHMVMLGDERQQSSARTAPSRPSRPQSLICSSRTAYTPAAVAISIISFNKFYKSADLVHWTNKSICARSAKKPADLAHEKFTTTNNSSTYKISACPTCVKTSRPGTRKTHNHLQFKHLQNDSVPDLHENQQTWHTTKGT